MSLHSFFSTYLLPSILSIIPSFLLVFKIGSVLMVYLLIGSHLTSHSALRPSQSLIPSLHFILFPVVYPKIPYLAHFFHSLYHSSWLGDLKKFHQISKIGEVGEEMIRQLLFTKFISRILSVYLNHFCKSFGYSCSVLFCASDGIFPAVFLVFVSKKFGKSVCWIILIKCTTSCRSRVVAVQCTRLY